MINHPILDLWSKILDYGKSYSLPQTKGVSILREYLQNKILDKIYSQKISRKIFFVGGTSLRILRGLDRFSEDLDFDCNKIREKELEDMFDNLLISFQKENFPVKGYKNLTKQRYYFELRFPSILYLLGFSQNQRQNLVIKLDFAKFWQGLKAQVVLVDRYGFIYRVNTLTKDQILSEKIHAYCNRQQTLGRDLYDIIWLLKSGAKIDWQFLKKNSFDKSLFKKIRKRWQADEKRIVFLKRSLQPLVINEENAKQIYYFPYYFPEDKEIECLGLEEKMSRGSDAYEFNFRFLVKKEKEISFTFIVSRALKMKANDDFKKQLLDKVISFYEFNPAINYQTKMITSYDIEDFMTAKDEELGLFLE